VFFARLVTIKAMFQLAMLLLACADRRRWGRPEDKTIGGLLELAMRVAFWENSE
jgi:hypothetical protein